MCLDFSPDPSWYVRSFAIPFYVVLSCGVPCRVEEGLAAAAAVPCLLHDFGVMPSVLDGTQTFVEDHVFLASLRPISYDGFALS